MWKILAICCSVWFTRFVVTNAYNGIAAVEYQTTQSWELFNMVQCGEVMCSLTTQECRTDYCICKPNYEQREDGSCHVCPMEGHACTGCCLGDAICYSGRCQRCYMDKSGECIPQTSLFFLTAAQVALATAMVIGVSALATLMYKTFRARSSRNNGQQVLENDLNRTGSSRISLTSIQIRVLRRLRDRPPKYETRHNYEFHQREQQSRTRVEQRGNTTPLNQQTQVGPIIGAPPPAYDGDVGSLVDFPPPYSAEPPQPVTQIAIVNEPPNNSGANTSRSTVNINEGILNRAFEHTEENGTKIEESSDINLVNSTKDKTIHI